MNPLGVVFLGAGLIYAFAQGIFALLRGEIEINGALYTRERYPGLYWFAVVSSLAPAIILVLLIHLKILFPHYF